MPVATLHLGDLGWAPPDKEAERCCWKARSLYGVLMTIHGLVPHDATGDVSLSVCVFGDGWFNLSTLIAQHATGVQPHPDPESDQTRAR